MLYKEIYPQKMMCLALLKKVIWNSDLPVGCYVLKVCDEQVNVTLFRSEGIVNIWTFCSTWYRYVSYYSAGSFTSVTGFSSVAMQEESSDLIEVRLAEDSKTLEVLLNQEVLRLDRTWLDLKGECSSRLALLVWQMLFMSL